MGKTYQKLQRLFNCSGLVGKAEKDRVWNVGVG